MTVVSSNLVLMTGSVFTLISAFILNSVFMSSYCLLTDWFPVGPVAGTWVNRNSGRRIFRRKPLMIGVTQNAAVMLF